MRITGHTFNVNVTVDALRGELYALLRNWLSLDDVLRNMLMHSCSVMHRVMHMVMHKFTDALTLTCPDLQNPTGFFQNLDIRHEMPLEILRASL